VSSDVPPAGTMVAIPGPTMVQLPTMTVTPSGEAATSETVQDCDGSAEKMDLESGQARADCRICLMDDSLDQLCSPCNCQGSVKWVHATCLEHWCRERGSLKCEICHCAYDTDSLSDGMGEKLLNAVASAQAEQAAARERQRQRRLLDLGMPLRGNNPILSERELFDAMGAYGDLYDREEHAERAAQVRRLVMFAVLVTVTMIIVHVAGSILLSNSPQGSEQMVSHATQPVVTTVTTTETPHTTTATTANNGAHDTKENMTPAFGRMIRAILFFYIIQSFFLRQPFGAEGRYGHRGGDLYR